MLEEYLASPLPLVHVVCALLCAYVKSKNPKGTFASVLSWGAIGFVLTVLGCHLQYRYVKSQTEDR